jgi:hypothetical protein
MKMEDFLNAQGTDIELFDKVCSLIQKNFEEYCDTYYYMHINEISENLCLIDEVKSFVNMYDKTEYFLDFCAYDPFIRFRKFNDHVIAQIMTKKIFLSYRLGTNKIISKYKGNSALEWLKTASITPRELVEGFAGIAGELKVRTIKIAK